jgi:hypothetical protein
MDSLSGGTVYRCEQARLAGTVGAGDSDLVAAKYAEFDLLEQRLRAASQGEIPSGEHQRCVMP